MSKDMKDLFDEERVELTRRQYEVFGKISKALEEDNRSQTDISGYLKESKKTLGRYFRIFEGKGLLKDYTPDKREKTYRITEEGERVLGGDFDFVEDFPGPYPEKLINYQKRFRRMSKVGKELDINEEKVRYHFNKLGKNVDHGLFEDEVEDAIELYKREVDYEPVLEKYNLSYSRFTSLLREHEEPLLLELKHKKILEAFSELNSKDQEITIGDISSVTGFSEAEISNHLKEEGIFFRERRWRKIPEEKEEMVVNMAKKNKEKSKKERLTQAQIAERIDLCNQPEVSKILKRNNVEWVGPWDD